MSVRMVCQRNVFKMSQLCRMRFLGCRLLSNDEVIHGQFADGQLFDSTAFDCESSDGQSSNGEGSYGGCGQSKGS